MKKKIILKIVLVMVLAFMMLAMSMNVLAVDDGYDPVSDVIDLDDPISSGDGSGGSTTVETPTTSTEDPTIDLTPDTPTTETPSTSTETPITETPITETPTTPTTPTTGQENNLPKTGIEDNRTLLVAIVVLLVGAIITYKKVNYYKNI